MRTQIRRALERVTGTRIFRQIPPGIDLAADLRRYVPGFSVQLIFDVGANTGQTADAFGREFPAARIHCFEPGSEIFAALLRNTRARPNVFCHQLAFGSRPHETQFVVDRVLSHIPHPGESLENAKVETISVGRVSDFCRANDISHIDFLKVDTEGHDLDVLKGASEMLAAADIGIVQVEAGMNPRNTTHVPFDDLKNLLAANDYYLFGFYEQVHEWSGEPQMRRSNPVFISPKIWRNIRWC